MREVARKGFLATLSVAVSRHTLDGPCSASDRREEGRRAARGREEGVLREQRALLGMVQRRRDDPGGGRGSRERRQRERGRGGREGLCRGAEDGLPDPPAEFFLL